MNGNVEYIIKDFNSFSYKLFLVYDMTVFSERGREKRQCVKLYLVNRVGHNDQEFNLFLNQPSYQNGSGSNKCLCEMYY